MGRGSQEEVGGELAVGQLPEFAQEALPQALDSGLRCVVRCISPVVTVSRWLCDALDMGRSCRTHGGLVILY